LQEVLVSEKGHDQTRASGVVDAPQGVDWLGVRPFRDGLARFIRSCQTPMTIAIQGDWGTGKTNMMMLAEEALAPHGHFRLSDAFEPAPEDSEESSVYTIRFNTWQYSQFDMGDQLVTSLFGAIGESLLSADTGGAARDKRSEFISTLTTVASAVGLGAAKVALDWAKLGEFKGVVDTIESKRRDNSDDQQAAGYEDPAVAVVELKQKFAAAVEELVQGRGPRGVDDGGQSSVGRVVIFIDDLDRLEPHKAVELMESLKLFLDVEHCVFVLAIDFSVVEQGVSAKYGATMDRTKARSFFDKIIQVPFQMPVGAYRIDQLLNRLIDETGLELEEEQRARFLQLVRYSVGNNPRAIKRLLNSFMLLRDISAIAADQQARSDPGTSRVSDSQLFAILCFQTAYPDAYAELVEKGLEESAVFRLYFSDDDSGHNLEGEADILERSGISIDTARFPEFVEALRRTFVDGSQTLIDSTFEQALNQAVTTSSGVETEHVGSRRGQKKYGKDARRSLLADSVKWNNLDIDSALQAPEVFIEAIGYSDRVSAGAQTKSPREWTIEVDGRRAGLLTVNKSYFNVQLETRLFGAVDPEIFRQEFIKRFPGRESSATARFNTKGEGFFVVKNIGHSESEARFAADFGGFWADQIAAYLPNLR
jgi:hypothetical protein